MPANTKLKRIAGVWKNVSRSTGQTYLQAKISVDEVLLKRGDKLIVLLNKARNVQNSPDYVLMLEIPTDGEIPVPKEPQDDFGSGDKPFDAKNPDREPGDDDGVPF